MLRGVSKQMGHTVSQEAVTSMGSSGTGASDAVGETETALHNTQGVLLGLNARTIVKYINDTYVHSRAASFPSTRQNVRDIPLMSYQPVQGVCAGPAVGKSHSN